MSDAAWLGILLSAFFVLRIIFATVFFWYILSDDDRCPMCNAITVRVQSRGWNLLTPWFRTSWCYECGWHGLLRHGPKPKDSKDGNGPAVTPDNGRKAPHHTR